MKRKDSKVLIIEDDATFGAAIFEAVQRHGYTAYWHKAADQALAFAKVTDIQIAIVDCMIPKMNGIEVAKKLRTEFGESLKIFLVSGIFKDRQFIRDSIDKTGAEAFFNKPFDIPEFLIELDQCLSATAPALPQPKDVLFSHVKPAELVQRMFAPDLTTEGISLPFILSAFLQSKKTGRLIVKSENKIGEIDFLDGLVQAVNWPDTQSYFGMLLIERGLLSEEELEDALKKKGKKRIGEHLVDLNTLSPHVVEIVNKEQTKVRISKMMSEDDVTMELHPSSVQPSNYGWTPWDLIEMFADWSFSKLRTEWIQNLFSPYMHYTVQRVEVDKTDSYKNFSVFKYTPHILELMKDGMTFSDYLDNEGSMEDHTLRSLYFMFMSGIVRLGAPSEAQTSDNNKAQRLLRMIDAQKNQNHFEILGLPKTARPAEIQQAYMNLAKIFHPDKVDPKSSDELRRCHTEVFTRIAQAYDVLRDDSKRQNYKRQLETGSTESLLQFEAELDEIKNQLDMGDFKAAYERLVVLMTKNTKRKDVVLYAHWAQMKIGIAHGQLEAYTNQLALDLQSIPPEDRYSHLFFFVKGLYHKITNNPKKAYTYFKHALTANRNFKPAHTESMLLRKQYEPKEKETLMTNVSQFFRKAK